MTSFISCVTATPEIYTLSLHDALPIFERHRFRRSRALRHCTPGPAKKVGLPARIFALRGGGNPTRPRHFPFLDRKSTRLNSSHVKISYAVFCLKKKKKKQILCENQITH